MEKKAWGVSGGTLKIIALVTMIIDHATAVFVNYYSQKELYNIGRCIGRLSFPIYCFLLVEGFYHTRSVRKYGMRLLFFAILSEVPFDLAFSGTINWAHQNVFFTLFLGLVLIWVTDMALKKNQNREIGTVMVCILLLLLYFVSTLVQADYGFYGVIMIYFFYLFHERKKAVIISNAAINGIMAMGGNRQIYGVFASVFFTLYNGKKGVSLKYFFYAIYPIHLLLFYYLKCYIT